MNISFENQAALITGAGSGIGLATAQAFAEAGAAVALADLNHSTVRTAADQLTAAGHQAIAIRCDVANETDAAEAVETDRERVRSPRCGLQQRRHSRPRD